MNITQILAILKARWVLALVVFGVILATAIVVSLLLPKRYTASASVVIDAKPDPISAMMYPGLASPAFMATQVDVIRSNRVAQRVVKNLKLAENPQVRAQWREETDGQGSIEDWLAATFQKQLDVDPSRESNVINISYKAPDPRFASSLANAFVQAYIETAIELRVDPAKVYSGFFDVRSKEAREALEKAQSKFSQFQREKGIVASDERLDVENARLNELSSQLVMLQALSAESVSRQAQATGGAGDRMQEVLNNPLISSLKADLSRAEAKLQEVNSRLGERHPQVLEAKASIAELRSRIDSETKRVTSGVGVTSAINRQRESQVRSELEAQRTKVLQMKAVRDEASVLMRDVENAQRAYEAIMARYNQTSLESQTTQSNVNVLTQASPPLAPSFPNIPLNAVLGAFVGGLLSVALSLIMELRDRRVRVVEDVSQSLGLPVLGVLPRPASKGEKAGRAALTQQRLVGQLPAPKGNA